MSRLQQKLLDRGLEQGHFVFASGQHADEKFEFDNISGRRLLRRKVARGLSVVVSEAFPECDTIVTVANGANVLATPVARQTGKLLEHDVRALTTRKTSDGDFSIVNGNVFARNRQCVVVDDVYTRGTNAAKVANVLTDWGGVVLGEAVVINRNPEGVNTLSFGEDEQRDVVSLISYPMSDWAPEDCMCATDFPEPPPPWSPR